MRIAQKDSKESMTHPPRSKTAKRQLRLANAPVRPINASTANADRPPSGWHRLKSLIPYVQRHKGMIALGLLMFLMMGLVGALPQLIIGVLTDCLKGSPQPLSSLTGPSRAFLHPFLLFYVPLSRRALGVYCALLVGVMLVKDVLSFWARRTLNLTSRKVECDLRNDLFARLLTLDPEFYVRNPTGDLMSRVTNDLNAVRMLLGPGMMFIATTASVMAVTVYFMFHLSPTLTLWVLLPLPIISFVDWYFGQAIRRLSEQIQDSLGKLSARVQENLAGIRVIRAFVQERPQTEAFSLANREYANSNIRLIQVWSLFFPSLSVLIGVTLVIPLWIGGRQVITRQITVGTLWALYAFLVQLAWPMIALGWATNIFQRGAASMGRLNRILAEQSGISSEASVRTMDEGSHRLRSGDSSQDVNVGEPARLSLRGEIEFRHLTFAYPGTVNGRGNGPILNDINLHVPAGSTVAVVGPTGSGKSTLVALLAGLWEAPPGTLLIDGQPIEDYSIEELREDIGYVPQDVFLFSKTVRENIAFGVSDPSDQEIREAAEFAALAEDIEGFPEQFETIIGERGVTLSGGQKQRMTLARAVLRRPTILILDDALSSVDTKTEKEILLRLRRTMRQRTTILVSHRLASAKDAQVIIVLNEGRIIECGTHEELLSREGYYADICRKQQLEEELEHI